MRPRAFDPALYAIQGAELPLSGAALADLLRAVLARGVPFRFRAKGWSMAPFICDGDVISIAPLGAQALRTGEVVAFLAPGAGRLGVHRVIARGIEGCLIQGDNNFGEPDGLVPYGNILGRVIAITREGRAIWLGLGPERLLIALLMRKGWLLTAERYLESVKRRLKKVRTVDNAYVQSMALPELKLFDRLEQARVPLSFDIEVTARCNNNCRHCYLNLPAGDSNARAKELTPAEISDIAEQAVALGSLWCLLTGGEPLLREDFPEIYLSLRRKGLLVSLFTNACLITPEHVRLFRSHPPRDVEVTVYGVTEETYERVTRRKGSYQAFRRGLDLLLEGGVRVRLKAMALRSNAHELGEIARFCRERTRDYFRFDPQLHLRYDGDPLRNEEIRAERLSPEEVVALEQADEERSQAMLESCDRLIIPEMANEHSDLLFHCGTGQGHFAISYDGIYRPCSSLWHPDCLYDLRHGTLREAWLHHVPRVRAMRTTSRDYLERCGVCPLINLCLWCPAHAYLETRKLDAWCDYFCRVAHARGAALQARLDAERATGDGARQS